MSQSPQLFIASDHAAYQSKQELIEWLKSFNYQVVDLGTDSEESCHYPEYAMAVATKISNTQNKGILLCGSGIGVSMVANRFKGVRAAVCRTSQDATLSRQHNNSNVLCLGARFSSSEEIHSIVKTWLETEFEGGRHQTRVDLFNQLGENI